MADDRLPARHVVRLRRHTFHSGDEVTPFDEVVADTLRFAADGSTWGVVAVADGRLVFASSKGTVTPIDLEEIMGELMRRRSPAGYQGVLDGLVTAELEKASRP